MPTLKATVARYIDEEPQPGLVECVLVDASGRSHVFVEKTAVVSAESLFVTTAYPVDCELACEVESQWIDDAGESLVRVCTERPWGLESTAGQTVFVVRASQLSAEKQSPNPSFKRTPDGAA